jgi:hypothetical protein
MTHYLVYYREYWDDFEQGYQPSQNWSSNSVKMYKTVKPRDTFWVVVSGGSDAPDRWFLLERIHIARIERQPTPDRWGKYLITGDKNKSQLFSLRAQPDFTAILWLLKFASGKRIKILGRRIGLALQSNGFRSLAESDAVLLEDYVRILKLAKRNKVKVIP